ncbi:hypothetical protein PoB_006971100 [Plakobranchus ocellatus]|uniref:Uncharacterized protein n=1 Tax=Plakobranchus ocellatus TaxID=259542 RepID=A0AAV4DGA7_9GAST|nr:hypothetical protein PoB_006971100 [Plakobranchus ocellatus]
MHAIGLFLLGDALVSNRIPDPETWGSIPIPCSIVRTRGSHKIPDLGNGEDKQVCGNKILKKEKGLGKQTKRRVQRPKAFDFKFMEERILPSAPPAAEATKQ